jgi:hypothetical protein
MDIDHVRVYLTCQLSYAQNIAARASYIDRSEIIKQFKVDALAYAKHQTEYDEYLEGSIDWINSITDLGAIFEAREAEDPPPSAYGIIQFLVSKGLAQWKAMDFLERYLDTWRTLDAITEYIKENGLHDIYDNSKMIYCHQPGTSLNLLRRIRCRMAQGTLTRDFINSECDDSVLRVLCDQIESDDNEELLRSTIMGYLAQGVNAETHAFLEQRELTTSKENVSAYNTDPQDSSSRGKPNPCVSPPVSVLGRSGFEWLEWMGDIGLLSEAAQRGIAIEVVEHCGTIRWPKVLCRYIDRVGRHDEFATFVYFRLKILGRSDADGLGSES